jgi:hypothetical protein
MKMRTRLKKHLEQEKMIEVLEIPGRRGVE